MDWYFFSAVGEGGLIVLLRKCSMMASTRS